jgi:hypothetical protein
MTSEHGWVNMMADATAHALSAERTNERLQAVLQDRALALAGTPAGASTQRLVDEIQHHQGKLSSRSAAALRRIDAGEPSSTAALSGLAGESLFRAVSTSVFGQPRDRSRSPDRGQTFRDRRRSRSRSRSRSCTRSRSPEQQGQAPRRRNRSPSPGRRRAGSSDEGSGQDQGEDAPLSDLMLRCLALNTTPATRAAVLSSDGDAELDSMLQQLKLCGGRGRQRLRAVSLPWSRQNLRALVGKVAASAAGGLGPEDFETCNAVQLNALLQNAMRENAVAGVCKTSFDGAAPVVTGFFNTQE